MERVKDKVCIVTGAAMGLGKADAEALAREGAYVIVADIDSRGAATATQIGPRANFVAFNVTIEDEWRALIADTVRQFGRLDVLVNNAGVVKFGSIETMPLEDWNRDIAVSLTGTFLGCKHALPAMRSSGGGSIINMGSVAALVGIPPVPAYTAAKGGIRSLTRLVAVQCARDQSNVRCNIIHPGSIDTPMIRSVIGDEAANTGQLPDGTRLSRLGQPNDIANAVVFLASDESRMMNGADFVLDRSVTIQEGFAP